MPSDLLSPLLAHEVRDDWGVEARGCEGARGLEGRVTCAGEKGNWGGTRGREASAVVSVMARCRVRGGDGGKDVGGQGPGWVGGWGGMGDVGVGGTQAWM
jgi:hypothetical protein